ncbi:MAG: VanZ family protein [Chloroflexi bacterium]|nr:VanZ family protein [Chloroflexota bacterium]
MKLSRWWALALLWPLSIFVTSCYYINSPEFVHFVRGLVGSGWFGARFAAFWFSCGLFVVKGWHFTEYAVLCVLATRLLQRSRGWSVPRTLPWSVLFCVAFAASDEWHQTFVPGRDGCFRDVCIDSAGVLLSAWILSARNRRELRGVSAPPEAFTAAANSAAVVTATPS